MAGLADLSNTTHFNNLINNLSYLSRIAFSTRIQRDTVHKLSSQTSLDIQCNPKLQAISNSNSKCNRSRLAFLGSSNHHLIKLYRSKIFKPEHHRCLRYRPSIKIRVSRLLPQFNSPRPQGLHKWQTASGRRHHHLLQHEVADRPKQSKERRFLVSDCHLSQRKIKQSLSNFSSQPLGIRKH